MSVSLVAFSLSKGMEIADIFFDFQVVSFELLGENGGNATYKRQRSAKVMLGAFDAPGRSRRYPALLRA